MRALAPSLCALLVGCYASVAPGDEYAPFPKDELRGTWHLRTETGEVGEVRFVIDEEWLYVYAELPVDRPLIMGWRIEEHVELGGDGSCLDGCVIHESGFPWYERSAVAVAWATTQLFAETPGLYAPLELPPPERVDPIARAERSSEGAVVAFEVPARFRATIGETDLRFFFSRHD